MKQCIACNEVKPDDSFTFYDKKKGKRRNICKACQNVFNRDLPNAVRTRRNVRLKREFGITVDDYEFMFKSQNGRCWICKKKCKTHKNLSVDHDHATGQVRGLLCFKCNTALGNFGDDVILLAEAIKYLTTWQV